MTIRYKCDKCGSVLKIKDRLAGTAGKCPKCKTKFQVPEPSSAEARSPQGDEEEFSEEDAIFGKDFFTQQDAPVRPIAMTPAESNDSDAEIDAPKSAAIPPAAAPPPLPVDNSANIAGQLLLKTGKKNRPDDWQDPRNQATEYDFSAVRYVLLYRFLPLILVGIALATGSYFLFNAGEGIDLPPLGEVTGIVKLDGQPVEAELSFMPDNGRAAAGGSSGSSSIGHSGEDGRYTVNYKADAPGALIGKHQVLITVGQIRIVQSQEVKEGENQIDFDLTTPVRPQL
jgi:phage FluMu protein Com